MVALDETSEDHESHLDSSSECHKNLNQISWQSIQQMPTCFTDFTTSTATLRATAWLQKQNLTHLHVFDGT